VNDVKKIMGFMVVSFILVACASTSEDQGYLKSQNGPDLVVAPPMTKKNLSYFYELPAQNQDARMSINPPAAS